MGSPRRFSLNEARSALNGAIAAGPGAIIGAPSLQDTLTLIYAPADTAVADLEDWCLLVQQAQSGLTSRLSRKLSAPASKPLSFALYQNQPNPFGTHTQIHFDLPEASQVRLEIFDLQGRLVRRLVDAHFAAGRWSAEWDGTSDKGGRSLAGVYFYRIQAGLNRGQRRLVLLP
jgi:hypothetical protein